MGGEKGTRLLTIFLMTCMIQICDTACAFTRSPISTTFDDKIKDLKLHLPLDYPVTTVSNLINENSCLDIWHLYFCQRKLKTIANVCGEELKKKINGFVAKLEFIERCGFQVSSNCLIQERMNITVFLDKMSNSMKSVEKNYEKGYSQCTNIVCNQEQIPEEKQNFFLPATADLPHKDQQWDDNKQQGDRSARPNEMQFYVVLVSVVLGLFLIVWIN
ncbi:fms-related tyrosine kinase 3 ligand isoform X2 [Spea bombifrons]|uniref:fms-related tyrosine kinase 3 ligand isoform X2 n=1 Tax=Spea bombifrons TaxID=233779 RepID=UPI002349E507|nr:fms-related tyrosine kinase 3 ligand isoform X2 [Spea bombifrons]